MTLDTRGSSCPRLPATTGQIEGMLVLLVALPQVQVTIKTPDCHVQHLQHRLLEEGVAFLTSLLILQMCWRRQIFLLQLPAQLDHRKPPSGVRTLVHSRAVEARHHQLPTIVLLPPVVAAEETRGLIAALTPLTLFPSDHNSHNNHISTCTKANLHPNISF